MSGTYQVMLKITLTLTLTLNLTYGILGLWTLEERQNRADLIEVFKMAHGLSAIPLTDMFQIDTTGRTRGHSLKLVVGATRILESISSLIEWCPSGICWIMIL